MRDHSLHHVDTDLPFNEDARLATLQSYHVLDTLPEQAFDDLTALASQICGTPISLVSLVDQNRQWFKSRHGWDVEQGSRDDAFCAHALHRPNELLIVPDASRDERFASNPAVTGESSIRFYMGAPLVAPSGDVLGTLCVVDREPRQLSLDQQNALRSLARQTMAQLELRRQNIELTGQIALRVQTEATLRESEARFQTFMDRSPLTAFLKDESGRYTYVNRMFLERVHREQHQVIGRDDFELWPDIAPQLRERDLRVLAGEENVGQVERSMTTDGKVSYWQIFKFPLQRGGGARRFVAGVGLDVTQNKLDGEQLKAYQCQLQATLKQVHAQSLEDALTGLHNRRAFDSRISEEVDRARRYDLPLSLLMIDVDNFKAFNDNFGHPEGDEVLKTVAWLLKEKARGCDFVARYGGEEFVILLANTTPSGALMAGERFRQAIQAMPWSKRQVSISVGVATLVADMEAGKSLISAADTALYAAKQKGRNCVVQAQ